MKNINIIKKITPELAYICGVLAGDGSINIREEKGDYEIKCVGNPKDEKEYYQQVVFPLFFYLFGLNVKPRYFDKNTTYGIRIWSKNLVKYLTEYIGLPSGKKYDFLKIPLIFYHDKKLIRYFITGLFDTDFSISIGKNDYPRIRGVSKSECFINEIIDFLWSDGFVVSKFKRDYYDGRVKKNLVNYEVCLSGRKNLNLWIRNIGTFHNRHIKKIKIAERGFEPLTFTQAFIS